MGYVVFGPHVHCSRGDQPWTHVAGAPATLGSPLPPPCRDLPQVLAVCSFDVLGAASQFLDPGFQCSVVPRLGLV